MKTAVAIVGRLAGLAGVTLVILGLVMWIGHVPSLIPLHMVIGTVFVLAVWVLCALGLQAKLFARSAATFAWSLVVPAFGYTQMQILPGPNHWVIRVLHLAVGIVAMGLARSLAVRSYAALAARETSGDPSSRAQAARPTP